MRRKRKRKLPFLTDGQLLPVKRKHAEEEEEVEERKEEEEERRRLMTTFRKGDGDFLEVAGKEVVNEGG